MEVIYEELVHVKALSHLSSLVKKELAKVLLFEAHPYKNTISTTIKFAVVSLFLKYYAAFHIYFDLINISGIFPIIYFLGIFWIYLYDTVYFDLLLLSQTPLTSL